MVEDISKGDMLLKTGQMAVRVMRDFQVLNAAQQIHSAVIALHTLHSNTSCGTALLARMFAYINSCLSMHF